MTKPKIFVFVNGRGSVGVIGLALAEDGTDLAGHCSSNELWLRRDMGLVPEVCKWQHEKFEAHYPTGFDLVDLIDMPFHEAMKNPEFAAAVALANAKAAANQPQSALSEIPQ